MSIGYRAVQWSGHKRVYDMLIALAVVAYFAVFFVVGKLIWGGANAISDEVLLIRAAGSCGFVLLHVILCIGPLARLDRRFLPVLYNRRHLGVITFLVSLLHAAVSLGYYHGFGVINPLLSLLDLSNSSLSVRGVPFQILGAGALVILFFLAATSHDFWLKNLSPGVWKRLHMSVYVAYGLLVAHVSFGALQTERGGLAALVFVCGAVVVCGLHLIAGVREVLRDRVRQTGGAAPAMNSSAASAETDSWIDAGAPNDIPEDRARTVCTAGGERIAVFRTKGTISAVTNVCAHQGGPLGEGKVIDGCITCPWHGWQYRPGDGCSPPPFVEKIATYQVRIVDGRVRVHPTPLPPGTPTPPAVIGEATHG